MKSRLLSLFAAVLLLAPSLNAQELPKGFEADTTTLVLREKGLVNDYSAFGVNFGPTVSRLFMNPSGYRQGWLYNPWYFSLSYIKNLKMFDILPYFGYQIGIAYGHEGYRFLPNKESGYQHSIEGASEVRISTVEIPFMVHGHIDWSHFKLMLNAGPYLGYRLGITRVGDSVTPGLENSFSAKDYRWDYGLYGGLGFAIVFDPVEIHFNAIGHLWSWGSLYIPNYHSEYYYSFAYPLDINFTVGIYFQLGKRFGKTTRQLKKEAYEIVYQNAEDGS